MLLVLFSLLHVAVLVGASSSVYVYYELNDQLPPHMALVEPVITPRFVPTCSDELLKGLGRLSAEQGLRVQSHMVRTDDPERE